MDSSSPIHCSCMRRASSLRKSRNSLREGSSLWGGGPGAGGGGGGGLRSRGWRSRGWRNARFGCRRPRAEIRGQVGWSLGARGGWRLRWLERQGCLSHVGLRLEEVEGVEAFGLTEFGAHIVIHGSESRRVADALQRLEIEFGEIDAIPIEPASQLVNTGGNRAKAIAVGQVHQLSPVELCVLQNRGLFPPLGMIVPELLANVGQLQPGVNLDAFPMAGLDQAREVTITLGVGFVEVPGSHMEGGDTGLAPSRRVVIQVHAQAVRRIEEGPQAGRTEGRFDAEIAKGLEKVRKAVIAVVAG